MQLGQRRGAPARATGNRSSSSFARVVCFLAVPLLFLWNVVMTKKIFLASEDRLLPSAVISTIFLPADNNAAPVANDYVVIPSSTKEAKSNNYNSPPAAAASSSAPAAWQSKNSAVLAVASGLGIGDYQRFVGSLRATGYTGHILLGISIHASSEILDYLKKNDVTTYVIEPADQCTHHGSIGSDGKPLDTNNSHEWHCPKNYPDYKITWARFFMYQDWLNECSSCTDGIMLTDARDAYFQAGE